MMSEVQPILMAIIGQSPWMVVPVLAYLFWCRCLNWDIKRRMIARGMKPPVKP
jgi:hypothetical protein